MGGIAQKTAKHIESPAENFSFGFWGVFDYFLDRSDSLL